METITIEKAQNGFIVRGAADLPQIAGTKETVLSLIDQLIDKAAITH